MSAIPKRIRDIVDRRDGMRDRYTGHQLGEGRNLHHRKLRSQGGRHTVGGLVTLAGSGTVGSHGFMHHNRLPAQGWGYIVPSWIADPSTVPIRVHAGRDRFRWVRFRDDGSIDLMDDLDEVTYEMHRMGIWKEGETWIDLTCGP